MNLLLGKIIFAIGFIIVLIAILMIDKMDSLSTFLFIIAIGIMLIGIIFARMTKNIENESLIEVDTKAESITETQTELAANSTIKVALMQNYPEAEIISNENDLQHSIFIYNNENYSFEVEDNILFIKQDKKLIKYIYLN
jgi:hypothetical protein